ncbi:protein BANP-like isoform X1 [Stegodyphus dumicola]|uniref:protein BANP-like isoform X1 n=1 Tax=Stegodyphus dumicola TaxID=202533 RepID=UPI0015B0FA77|nr:protein BANP-like isoform X1 [Stegodyphus dumicola]XP_035225355.1 protein BANP-like isoform X1 [Stegodyphus dumicola]XP_035225356.1 protein BANP-like isoform X1 [Stegodyphus dumicola]
MKQPKKKLKMNKSSNDVDKSDSVENLLAVFNKEITKKLDFIEGRLDFLSENFDVLEKKVETIASLLDLQRITLRTAVPCNGYQDNTAAAISVSPRVTFITLNTEEDYPNGSWLGDENNPEARVRCHISPMDLFHINTTCTTAEKMALTLLDHLFDRETQACSNISGMGKHRKKQLDPLFIYGIRCHLSFHFGISEQDWNKIKQNIDSKCRTAFRKKMKGLPLQPKMIHPEYADFQILQATPEQVAEIQQTHQIKFLSTGELLATPLPTKLTSSQDMAFLTDDSEMSGT